MPLRGAVLLSAILLAWSPTAFCRGDVSLGDIVRNLTADDTSSAEHQEIRSGLERIQRQLAGLQAQLEASQSTSDECPPGWNSHNRACYLIPAIITTWFAATAKCPAIDGRARLASVRLENHEFVEALVAGSDARYVWVGGVQLRKGSTEWAWQDGSAFDYTNWAQGQPDPKYDHCITLRGPRSGYNAHTGQWHNGGSCSETVAQSKFMCQITLT